MNKKELFMKKINKLYDEKTQLYMNIFGLPSTRGKIFEIENSTICGFAYNCNYTSEQPWIFEVGTFYQMFQQYQDLIDKLDNDSDDEAEYSIAFFELDQNNKIMGLMESIEITEYLTSRIVRYVDLVYIAENTIPFF